MSRMGPSEPVDRAAATAARNRRIGLICVVVFAGMVGAAFAAVPAYRAFCQVTGYGRSLDRQLN